MKRSRVLKTILFSILVLGVTLIGCQNGINEPNNSNKTENKDTKVETEVAATGLQSQIDSAAEGASVKLSAGSGVTGNSITIKKAIILDGDGIENLYINVNSKIANNVTIKNFKNAKIKISNTEQSRSAGDEKEEGAEEADSIKKSGEDALPIHLEGCTVDLLETDTDLALYMENGDKKTEIKELSLKEGVEDFTFIELDQAETEKGGDATATEDKSKVEKLKLEDEGIEKVNLVGGSFGEVTFTDDFTDDSEVKFNYDKEFSDQFEDKDFMEEDFVKEKDIGLAEKTLAENESGVYSFTISKDLFDIVNGGIFISFLTDSQAEAISTQGHEAVWGLDGPLVASYENPIYATMPTGPFKVTEGDTGLKTVYGTEWCYVDYAHAYARGLISTYMNDDIVELDYYRNYNKEAFIADVKEDEVIIYVNMAKVRKDDVIICVNQGEAYGENGTKLSEISLDGYKPYLCVDQDIIQKALEAEENISQEALETLQMEVNPFAITNEGESHPITLSLPYGDTIKMSHEVMNTFSPMTAAEAYPDVSTIEYSKVEVKDAGENPFYDEYEDPDAEYLYVYEVSSEGKAIPTGLLSKDMIYNDMEMENDPVKYYSDEECTKELTKAQIEKLPQLNKIYKKAPPVTLSLVIVTKTEEGDETEFQTKTRDEILAAMDQGEKFYSDQELTLEFTKESLMELTPGSTVYKAAAAE